VATNNGSRARNFTVPLSGDEHEDLFNFVRHLRAFTGLEIASSKGLGENPKVTIAKVQKAGSGVETFSLSTQDLDSWKYEFDTLIRGNGKAVRQLLVCQNNTKHAAGTVPLNMYKKELSVGDRVTQEPSSADDIGDQLSEYNSDFNNEEDSATHEEDAVEAVPVNFLSKTVCTHTGRQITLSYRALSS